MAESAQVLEGVDVALDEGRSVFAADQPHIAPLGFLPSLPRYGRLPQSTWALPPGAVWRSIVAPGCGRAAGDAYAALSSMICPIAQSADIAVQCRVVVQTFLHRLVDVPRVGVLLSLSQGSSSWTVAAWSQLPPVTSGTP